MSYIPPVVTTEQLRNAGYTNNAAKYPLSEAGVRWIAAFNGVPFNMVPPAWCYAPNPYMLAYVEEKANATPKEC